MKTLHNFIPADELGKVLSFHTGKCTAILCQSTVRREPPNICFIRRTTWLLIIQLVLRHILTIHCWMRTKLSLVGGEECSAVLHTGQCRLTKMGRGGVGGGVQSHSGFIRSPLQPSMPIRPSCGYPSKHHPGCNLLSFHNRSYGRIVTGF